MIILLTIYTELVNLMARLKNSSFLIIVMIFIAASSSITRARGSVGEDRFQHSMKIAFLFNPTSSGLSGNKPVDEAIMEEDVENNTYPKSTMKGTEIRASDDGESITTKSSAGCETVSKINNYMPLYLSLVVVGSAAIVLLTALAACSS